MAAFVVRQARIPNPLMPLRLFRSRNVGGANIVMALLVAGMFSMFFLGALYLQRVLGYDPLEVGLAFLPATLVMGTISLRLSSAWNMRFGAQRHAAARRGVRGRRLLLFARTPVDGSFVTDVLPAVVFMGLGAGLSFPSLMTLAMSGATRNDSGWRRAWSTPVQVGGAIGLALLATLASERTDGLRADGEFGRERLELRLPPRLRSGRGARRRGVRRGADSASLGLPQGTEDTNAEPAEAELAYSEAA